MSQTGTPGGDEDVDRDDDHPGRRGQGHREGDAQQDRSRRRSRRPGGRRRTIFSFFL
ncbi:MAG: hypothetical protein M0C28_04450 [Candidatus Moduliflexus flocculans]|nr:hypothetical protein [Candidatus Moduliflexus flocculans]